MPARSSTVIVPTMLGGERLDRMLGSLAAQSVEHETIVVDNGSPPGSVVLPEHLERGLVLRLERNLGYTRAINLAAERAAGEVIVLLNDDCVVDSRFVELISAPIDVASGVVMAAGVMRDWRHRSLIDSAGMELDRTLLVFDYLNGEPLTILDRPVADPIGPSGAAAAFDRATYLAAGGFDEELFAYYEDVDLVLRLRREGARCALARGARGDHEHSATLGSGSARKNRLMGFGRGYVLRKFGVVTARRLGPVLARDGVLCAGQGVVDRNLSGLRGRVQGYRHAEPSQPYPEDLPPARGDRAASTLWRRAKRRVLLRSAAPARSGSLDALAVFHLAQASGPSRSLEAEMRWLGEAGELTMVFPGPGRAAESMSGVGEVLVRDYEALTAPAAGALGTIAAARRLAAELRMFRGEIRRRRPRLVVQVTTMLPALALAARLERVPLLVYAGELLRGEAVEQGAGRELAARALLGLTGRAADGIVACSRAVAEQFDERRSAIELIYPPIPDLSGGDGGRLRAEHGVEPGAPLLAAVGDLTHGRGQDLLVEAMPALVERFPRARCLIVGDPHPRPADRGYRDRLAARVRELGLGESVALVGRIDRIADLYAAADLVVNPARAPESFGRVAFEAATAGTPAVSARVGACEELLRDGVSALFVPREDPAAIAAAAARLLADPGLGSSLAGAASEVVARELGPEHALERFRSAVDLALARSGS